MEQDRSGDRFQLRLGDLAVVIVGASYVLDVARRSRLAWGGGLPDRAHAIGLMVLSLGLCVGTLVVNQWARQLRVRQGWALLGSVLGLCWLAGSLVEVTAALQTAHSATAMPVDAMRLRLTTLMTALGMVGLMLGVAPLDPSSGRRSIRWGSWVSVPLAGLAGVALLALGHGMFPYLVLLATEAVHNALSRAPLVARPILFDRMLTSSLQALPGLLGCLATAAWVDDDVRAAARDPLAARTPRSWPGVLARSATVALALLGLVFVWRVSIPTLSPSLAEGIAAVVSPTLILTIILGFATLAAGLAVRSAAHLALGHIEPRPARVPGRWPRRVILGVVGLVCVEITAAAVQAIQRDLDSHWYIPLDLGQWGRMIQAPLRWLNEPTFFSGWIALIDRPDDFLIGGAVVWLTVRLVGLIRTRGSARVAPIDAIAADRLALGRSLGWWFSLTTAMVGSLPGLAVVATSLVHLLVRWSSR